MASLCERGEAFITCHCDLFAPWTGFKRGPTNFIGVNLATFSRLSAVELLTWHFSFEISKERERGVYVCVRGREEREVFFSRASMRIIHGVRGWETAEVKNWKIGVWSSKMKFGVNFFYGRCEICLFRVASRIEGGEGIEFIFIDLSW